MQGLSNYASLMTYYDGKKNNALASIEQLEVLKEYLRGLRYGIPELQVCLNDAKTCFESGGFISDGITFDKGKLDEWDRLLDANFTYVEGLLVLVDNKMEDFQKDITEFERQYNMAKENYRKFSVEEQ